MFDFCRERGISEIHAYRCSAGVDFLNEYFGLEVHPEPDRERVDFGGFVGFHHIV